MENESADDPRSALAAIDAGRAAAADRLVSPLWYHPVLGLLAAGYVYAIGSGNTIAMLIALPIYLGGLVALVASYKRATGIWISGFSAGRASWWAGALVVVLLGLIGLAYAQVWPTWAAAGATFVAVNVFGLLFDRTLRAGLRAGTIAVPR